jgi:hypothetical protein
VIDCVFSSTYMAGNPSEAAPTKVGGAGEAQSEHPPEAPPDVPQRTDEVGEVHLIYQIEGKQNDVPAFELSRTLEALGNVIQETDSLVYDDVHELSVKVRPFQEGSFIMDLVLSVVNNPTALFFLNQPEAIARIKQVLEYLGLIKKSKEIIVSLVELLQFLKNGKPAKVEPTGPDTFNYYNQEGQVMPVNQPIHNLINNGTIQQFIFPAVAAPLQRESVEAVRTLLANQPQTEVRLLKEGLPAIKAYSDPVAEPPKEEIIENTTTEFLNPKTGTYGDTEGTWTFTQAGSNKNPFRARITDEKFLGRYGRGAIRFYHDDVLKARVKREQRLKNGKSKTTSEIVEVLDYKPAPVKRAKRSKT